jgi:quercetin dioxygenase-like cupin family protein
MRTITLSTIILIIGLATGPVALAQHEHVLQNEKDVKWVDAPPFLPPGAKMALLEGDPKGKGLVSVRIKMPAGYKVAAHWHPNDEHVVVLSGTLYMGTGDKLDPEGGKALKVGGFSLMPAKMKHYAYTKEPTTILVYGMGPVEFHYVNPADDPRKAEKK